MLDRFSYPGFPNDGLDMDEDLKSLSRDELLAEVVRLRAGIRAHRDSSGQELCWHHPELWSLLPDGATALPAVPSWPEFMKGCVRYRQSLDTQLTNAPRVDDPYTG